jgi:translation elongation factor EF-G
VNIYKTARTAKQAASYTNTDREYELSQVFGGGNQAAYLPSAADAKLPAATNANGDAVALTRDGKMVATVAKTINDQFGKYSIVKVHRGTLDINVTPYNVNSEKAEKPSAPFLIRGKKTIALEKLNAGDMVYVFYLDSNGPDGEIDLQEIDFGSVRLRHDY